MQALEDIMAPESEHIPERTSRLNSLSPEDRRLYNKILWGLVGSYAAVIVVLMGVLIAGDTGLQKAADIIVTRTWAR
jgi:hypothetical protein